jgi:chaperonin cofactor prefoldin
MSKEILLVWQGTNEQSSGTIAETDGVIVVYLDNKSKWEQMEKDIEAYKNRIRVLENLNSNYREKLGLSNEVIEIPNVIDECNHENIQMKSSGIWKCKCGYTHF